MYTEYDRRVMESMHVIGVWIGRKVKSMKSMGSLLDFVSWHHAPMMEFPSPIPHPDSLLHHLSRWYVPQ